MGEDSGGQGAKAPETRDYTGELLAATENGETTCVNWEPGSVTWYPEAAASPPHVQPSDRPRSGCS